jgi:DNA-binding GntR family transcriptional regulator
MEQVGMTPVTIKRVSKKRTAETNAVPAKQRIYNHVHEQVSRGELPGGQVISELQLSRDLGTSRSPVREAIAQLIADGLLEQAPNRSAVVVDLKREDIIDLYEVREALEIYAVHKVAQRGLPARSYAQLQECLGELQAMLDHLRMSGERALNEEQTTRYSNLDMKFHSMLVLSAQNVRMQRIVVDTRLLVRIFAMRRSGHEVEKLEEIHRQHLSIVQAVAEGRADDAVSYLSAHIHTSLKERLEEFDFWKRENALRNYPIEFAAT